MRLLLTRPRTDGERSAALLARLGHEVELEPLLTIGYRPKPLDLEGVQALLVTSLNGLRAFLASSERRDLPVLAVGPASAEAARAAGFPSVRSAEGDAAALAELVIETLDADAGALFHPAGTVSASGLLEPLVEAGYAVRREVLYEATPVEQLSGRTQMLLRTSALDGVLFYSPRTAATFVALVGRADLATSCRDLVAYCLSPAVAAALEPLQWRAVRIATAPQEPALVKVITADESGPSGSERMAEETRRGEQEKIGQENAASANAAERLIARFGGLRPMAAKLGIAVSTVQGWKTRGHIPATRTQEIRDAAAKHEIALEEAELAAATAEQPAEDAPAGAEPWGAVPDEVTVTDEADADQPAMGGAAEGAAASPPPSRSRATPVPAAAAEPARRRGVGALIGGMLLGVLLVAAGAAAAVLTRPYWQPYLEAALPGFEQRIAASLDPLQARVETLEAAAPGDTGALEQQLSDLSERVAALEQQGVAAPAGGPEAAALQDRLEQLEAQVRGGGSEPAELAALKQEVGELRDALAAAGGDPQALEGFRNEVAALGARLGELSASTESLRQAMARVEVVQEELAAARSGIEDLEERLDGLSQQVEANASAAAETTDRRSRGALLALALGQLREALRFSEPYADELQSVAAVAEGQQLDALLQPLEAHAASGAPNLTVLRRQLSELAPEIVGASYATGEQGWLREVMERVPELVTVRPVGQAQGDGPGERVARAEQALAEGDLAAAVGEIEALEDEAAEAAAPWLEQARARLEVEAALAELTRRAVGELSGSRPAAGEASRAGPADAPTDASADAPASGSGD